MSAESTVVIKGDTTGLEESLSNVINALDRFGKNVEKKNATIGKKSGDEFGKGFENGVKDIQKIAEGGFSNIASSFFSLVTNPITLSLGALGAGFFTAFSLVRIDENNKKINASFESFATQAGLNADALRNRIGQIAEGFVGVDDVLPQVSKSILALGVNANKLPEIFELSRNIALKTGRDIQEVFDGISKGIADQNQKALKSNGIQINVNDAIDAYAKSLGTSTEKLTDLGKQQAILNAVLETGAQNFKSTGSEIAPVEGGIRKLGLAFSDLKDAFAAIINSKIGEFFAESASGFAKFTKSVADFATRTGPSLDEQIKSVKESIQEIENFESGLLGSVLDVAGVESNLKNLNAELQALLAKKAELENQGPEAVGAGPTQGDLVKNELTPEEIALADSRFELQATLNQRLRDLAVEQDSFEAERQAAKAGDEQALADATLEKRLAEIESLKQFELDKAGVIKDGQSKFLSEAIANANAEIASNKAKNDKIIADDARAAKEKQRNAQTTFSVISGFAQLGLALAEDGSEVAKALNVSQAIASTYLAATAALAPPPIGLGPVSGIPLAASTVAAGLANVVRIVAAKDGALVTNGIRGVDTEPFMLAKGELVAPQKSFDEVVEGVARQRGFVKSDQEGAPNGGVVINIVGDILADDLYINRLTESIREAVLYRDARLS